MTGLPDIRRGIFPVQASDPVNGPKAGFAMRMDPIMSSKQTHPALRSPAGGCAGADREDISTHCFLNPYPIEFHRFFGAAICSYRQKYRQDAMLLNPRPRLPDQIPPAIDRPALLVMDPLSLGRCTRSRDGTASGTVPASAGSCTALRSCVS